MVRKSFIINILFVIFVFMSPAFGQATKLHIFVVNSYNREYLWEQQNNEGFCAALLKYKFLDSKEQADTFTLHDAIETDKIVINRAWMDTKRKYSQKELKKSTYQIISQIKEFHPDIIILGDDNASNYIGNYFIDTHIPVVFRGIIGDPAKYLLTDTINHPGHNVTGVLKTGHPGENIEYLKKLVPEIKTFAILGDDSETSRSKAKEIIKYQDSGKSPLKLVATVLTKFYSDWQDSALALQSKVDAFFIVNHNLLKDENGVVSPFEVMGWYLRNIKKPECVGEKQFVQEGALITVDDSAYKQSYEAVKLMYLIVHDHKKPADIPCVTPPRGAIIVNRQRAQMLGIDLSSKGFIEEFVDKAIALESAMQK